MSAARVLTGAALAEAGLLSPSLLLILRLRVISKRLAARPRRPALPVIGLGLVRLADVGVGALTYIPAYQE
ncbi:MAG: hypothetical protein R2748_32610 [Bryobacterales bacterium]